MSLNDLNANHQDRLEQEAMKYRGIEKAILKVGADVFNRQIGSGSSTGKRFAVEKAITAMRSYARKSEAEATRNAESHDFDIGPATPGQQAAAATHALGAQALANAATRRLQSWGVSNPSDDDVTRAIQAVLNVSWTSYEGEEGQTRVDSNPAVAARLREMGDESIWMDMSNPRQMARPPMDVEAVISNFEGVRNLGYTNQRRAMPDGTNFSSPGGSPAVGANASAPAAGGAVAGPTTDLSASSLAAAYAAGVAAGSNFAKRAARRGR